MLTPRKIQYIKENGFNYRPAVPPGILIRGQVGDCFDASIMNVLANGFTYVEGIAKNPLTGEWIHHAWVTDGSAKAFDPTWKMSMHGIEVAMPTEYIGIPLKTTAVLNFMRETEYKALFENGWRNMKLFRQALPNHCPVYDFAPDNNQKTV